MSKTILITGATAGFGRAFTQRLVADGHRVIAIGRRRDRLDALAASHPDCILPIGLDVTDAHAVAALPAALPPEWREVDVLINNAGLALGFGPAQDARLADWDTMIATNITGVTHVTRAFLPGMVARGTGHVINLGSTAGSYPYAGGHIYCATKAFIHQFSLALRGDLLGTDIRVTCIEPGLVGGSEFSHIRLGSDAAAGKVYEGTTPLMPADIAETVAWVIGLPRHVNINTIEMMPTCQAPAAPTVKRAS